MDYCLLHQMNKFGPKQARKGFQHKSAMFVIQNQFEVFYFRLNCM